MTYRKKLVQTLKQRIQYHIAMLKMAEKDNSPSMMKQFLFNIDEIISIASQLLDKKLIKDKDYKMLWALHLSHRAPNLNMRNVNECNNVAS